MTVISYVVRV